MHFPRSQTKRIFHPFKKKNHSFKLLVIKTTIELLLKKDFQNQLTISKKIKI